MLSDFLNHPELNKVQLSVVSITRGLDPDLIARQCFAGILDLRADAYVDCVPSAEQSTSLQKKNSSGAAMQAVSLFGTGSSDNRNLDFALWLSSLLQLPQNWRCFLMKSVAQLDVAPTPVAVEPSISSQPSFASTEDTRRLCCLPKMKLRCRWKRQRSDAASACRSS